MEGPLQLNVGTSVFKRETRPLDEVAMQLQQDGWEQTGSLGDRVLYFEKSGIAVTAIEGPLGTVVLPSGPIRGRLFGDSGLQLTQDSVLGTGRVEGETGRQMRKSEQMSNQIT